MLCRIRAACAWGLVLLLSGCGGGGGDGDGGFQTQPPPVVNASPGGIWQGSVGSGQQVVGLVTENGEFHFLADDGVQYFGTVSTEGNKVTGNFTAYTDLGTTFEDGSTRASGTLEGTLSERSTFTATTTLTTSEGTTYPGSVSLTYNALYDRDSSLATISGNFVEPTTNNVLNLTTDGTAFMQDPATGCVINGTVSIIDASFNAYRIEFSYANCNGANAILNGVTFKGLATLDNTVSPEELIIGVQAEAGGKGISEIFALLRI